MKLLYNCCFCKNPISMSDFCTVGKIKQNAHIQCAMENKDKL